MHLGNIVDIIRYNTILIDLYLFFVREIIILVPLIEKCCQFLAKESKILAKTNQKINSRLDPTNLQV